MVPSSTPRLYKGNAMFMKKETFKKVGTFTLFGGMGTYAFLRYLGLSDDVGEYLKAVAAHTTGETLGGIPIGWWATASVIVAGIGLVSTDLVRTFFTQVATKALTLGVFGGRLVSTGLQGTAFAIDAVCGYGSWVANWLSNHEFSRLGMGTNSFTCRWLVTPFRKLEESIEAKWSERAKQDSSDRSISEVDRGVRMPGFQNLLGHAAFATVLVSAGWLTYHHKTGANLPETLAAGYHHVFGSEAVAEEAGQDVNIEQASIVPDPFVSELFGAPNNALEFNVVPQNSTAVEATLVKSSS